MQVRRQFHCIAVILLVLSLVFLTNVSADGSGDQNLSISSGSLITDNEVWGNSSVSIQTILLDSPLENETVLVSGSDTGDLGYPGTGNETPALNNSSQVNNGTGISSENWASEPNESVKDIHVAEADNFSDIPVTYCGLETGSLTVLSTRAPSVNYQPKIDGENIVWCVLDPVNQTSSIVLYNCTTGEETLITPQGNLDYINPAISGNYIVYTGQAPDDPIYRVYLYQIDTATTSLLSSADDQSYRVSPVISGNYVVWTEFDTGYGRIILHNLQTNISSVISPDSTLLDNSLPSISGDFVVWQVMDTSNSTCSLMLHQITTSISMGIPSSDGSTSQMAPSISGDRIVYADGNWGEWDIMEYSISTGEYRKISHQKVINNNPQTAVDGDLAAWVDTSEAYGNIYLYDRKNNTVSLLTPADTNYSSKTGPSLSGERIVWECNNFGEINIFMFTRGPPAENLVADFGVNQTIGTPPLVVWFTSLTQGSPNAWIWDFGDGSTGRGQEVIHTYENPGLYSVTLTVNNPFYRNTTLKVDLINVATPPEAGFSTNTNSGPAPLTVQFQDLSTGSPANWSWDFGDGEYDNTTCPLHTYQDPGVYSPRLLVTNDFGNNSLVKDNYILVLPASYSTSTAGLDGVEIFEKEGRKWIALNISRYTGSFSMSPDNQVLTLNPPQGSWIRELILTSGSEGFTSLPDGFIIGSISDLRVITGDIPMGTPAGTDVPGQKMNITLSLKNIPLDGELNSVSWDGITSSDFIVFSRAINYAGFVGISGSAYTVRVDTPGIEPAENVTLHFTVNSSWVLSQGGRDKVYVLRKANDGGLEVLPTTFAGYNSEENMDYFTAYSPHGMSTFVVSSLHGSGNPLQLFYMSVSSRVSPSSGSGGGGGGSYGGSGNQISPSSASAGSQQEYEEKGAPNTPAGNNGQSSSGSQESVSPGPQSASPPQQGSNVPAANPPVLPPQPTNSIFTILIEVAAVMSVILIVVISVTMRIRARDKD